MAIPRMLCRFRFLINNDFTVVSKYSSIITSVNVNKCIQVHAVRQFRTNLTISSVANEMGKEKKEESSSSSSSSSSDSDSDDDDVTVEYYRGLVNITLPLPGREEKVVFALKPITHCVGDFRNMIEHEDKKVEKVIFKRCDGTVIASSNTIESLLDDDFRLIVNDKSYNVSTPKPERLAAGTEVEKLNEIKTLVHNLYTALNIQDHQVKKEVEMNAELETLLQELQPLEEKRMQLEIAAEKRGNWLAWVGLGLMSVQFGILARLTWWEYSWDIMEPVTYFVTYGTAMACYAYYVLTREEYILNTVRDRQHLLVLHKKAKKLGLDLGQYNALRERISRLEFDLQRLRDPIKMRVPPKAATPPAPAEALLKAAIAGKSTPATEVVTAQKTDVSSEEITHSLGTKKEDKKVKESKAHS